MLKAYILIDVRVGTVAQVMASLKAFQEVRYAYRVTGPNDIIAMVEVLDMRALGGLLADRVHSLPNIDKTTTCIVTT